MHDTLETHSTCICVCTMLKWMHRTHSWAVPGAKTVTLTHRQQNTHLKTHSGGLEAYHVAYGHSTYIFSYPRLQILIACLCTSKPRTCTTTMVSTSTHESRTSMESGSILSPIISPSASYVDLSTYNPPVSRGPRQRPRRESAASSIFSLTSSLGTVMDWKSPKEYGTSGANLSSQ